LAYEHAFFIIGTLIVHETIHKCNPILYSIRDGNSAPERSQNFITTSSPLRADV